MDAHPDPWHWTIQDVQLWFRHHAAAGLSSTNPHRQLPPIDPFLQTLQENGVAGVELLLAVDGPFLTNECGIKSLSTRAAILQCIIVLTHTAYSTSMKLDSVIFAAV